MYEYTHADMHAGIHTCRGAPSCAHMRLHTQPHTGTHIYMNAQVHPYTYIRANMNALSMVRRGAPCAHWRCLCPKRCGNNDCGLADNGWWRQNAFGCTVRANAVRIRPASATTTLLPDISALWLAGALPKQANLSPAIPRRMQADAPRHPPLAGRSDTDVLCNTFSPNAGLL